ncbi:leucyl aminopeptidase [Candidatus Sulfurimonas marisnigri]|uniref:Probable cytosol aminopeptidase n=1 Tax=Candidatus Sulfurimonas marisnigri TaxID=2740405 RepID=A0A7S7RRL2_9BACT|nr:leucyl aminopeptidase [Candidatus Sulfurimonas marisnigri]QOY55813.1 leucyl aminopeptidase [Candidatus Sulfurimonas marisnigri]
MNIQLLNKNITDIEAQVIVTFLTKDELKEHKEFTLLNNAGFTAEQDSKCFLYEKATIYCGIDSKNSDDVRSASAVMIKALKASNYTSAKLDVVSIATITAIVEGVVLGGYEFNQYKSKPKKTTLENISLCCNDSNFEIMQKTFKEALIVANATCFTRDIVNTAPQEMHPQSMVELAKKLASDNSLECDILQEKELEEEDMGAMLAVGRASVHGSALIHLSYKPANPKKIISLVGKGLTYDSGGLSLKPATSMVTMKMDKAGACAVMGMIKAASELKLDVEIHAFIGAVENMVGGNAYKPDDILVSRSGTTIEVRNTDAEGRLVLADVLTYAQDKVKADYIFDFATLTGACMVALGQYTTGIMGHSKKVKHDFLKAGTKSGELVGSLPFNRHLKKLLKSEIADISNVSSKPYGGAITAGLFLDKFIQDDMKDKWMHFDIAGSAYTEAPWDCNVHGATGAGVRMVSHYLKNI